MPAQLSKITSRLREAGIKTLILGCTHYPILKEMIQECVGSAVQIIDQNEIVPAKLMDYLSRHPEIEVQLSHTAGRMLHVTDYTQTAAAFAAQLFGDGIEIESISSLA